MLDKNKIIEKTIAQNGITFQSVIAMEECSELSQAISKCIRNRNLIPTKEREHLIEEMADIMICLDQLKIMYHVTDDELNCWIESKINRLERRLSV